MKTTIEVFVFVFVPHSLVLAFSLVTTLADTRLLSYHNPDTLFHRREARFS